MFNAVASQIELLLKDKTSLLRDQQELLQAVAHEFRVPLSRLNFALDMAVDSKQKEFEAELLADIREALRELKDLVTEVLRYSRLQPGTPYLDMQKVSINHIVTDIIEHYRNVAPNIKFDKRLKSDESININIDPNYFHRALKNLLSNAERYAENQVVVRMFFDERRFCVSIEDDGFGIPPHQRKRVFEPFTRLDPSR